MPASELTLLETDTFRFFSNFARRPHGELGQQGGAIWYHSRVLSPSYNGVLGQGTEIDATLERARSWNIPARWSISSASTPASFEAELANRGLELTDQWPGMVARIEDLPRAALNETTCEVVRTPEVYDEYAAVFIDALSLSGPAADALRDAHAWPCLHDPDRVYFLLRQNGRAVATGLLHHGTPGVAGVYTITVRRDCQGQGLGKLATLLTIDEGLRRGAKLAILQATKAGLPLYEKLGFRTLTTFRGWRIT